MENLKNDLTMGCDSSMSTPSHGNIDLRSFTALSNATKSTFLSHWCIAHIPFKSLFVDPMIPLIHLDSQASPNRFQHATNPPVPRSRSISDISPRSPDQAGRDPEEESCYGASRQAHVDRAEASVPLGTSERMRTPWVKCCVGELPAVLKSNSAAKWR